MIQRMKAQGLQKIDRVCMSHFSHHWGTVSNTHVLEETFNLVHCFKGFSPWLIVPREKYHGERTWQNKATSFIVANKQSRRTVAEWKGKETIFTNKDLVSMSVSEPARGVLY